MLSLVPRPLGLPLYPLQPPGSIICHHTACSLQPQSTLQQQQHAPSTVRLCHTSHAHRAVLSPSISVFRLLCTLPPWPSLPQPGCLTILFVSLPSTLPSLSPISPISPILLCSLASTLDIPLTPLLCFLTLCFLTPYPMHTRMHRLTSLPPRARYRVLLLPSSLQPTHSTRACVPRQVKLFTCDSQDRRNARDPDSHADYLCCPSLPSCLLFCFSLAPLPFGCIEAVPYTNTTKTSLSVSVLACFWAHLALFGILCALLATNPPFFFSYLLNLLQQSSPNPGPVFL